MLTGDIRYHTWRYPAPAEGYDAVERLAVENARLREQVNRLEARLPPAADEFSIDWDADEASINDRIRAGWNVYKMTVVQKLISLPDGHLRQFKQESKPQLVVIFHRSIPEQEPTPETTKVLPIPFPINADVEAALSTPADEDALIARVTQAPSFGEAVRSGLYSAEELKIIGNMEIFNGGGDAA